MKLHKMYNIYYLTAPGQGIVAAGTKEDVADYLLNRKFALLLA